MHVKRTKPRVDVQIAPADVAQWDNCRRQVAYEHIWQVQPASPHALEVFGRCIEQSVHRFLLDTALGNTPNPIEHFDRLWTEATTERPPAFRERENVSSFERAGAKLMRMLPGAWKRTGLTVARRRDDDDTPWVQQPASMEWDFRFDDSPPRALELIGTLGVIVERPALGRGLLQVATVRTPHSHSYTRRADILTGNQVLFDEERNDPFYEKPLDAVGFWDFIKTENNAWIAEPLFVPPRGPAAQTEFCEKVDQMSVEIVKERFYRTSRWQWNTPCAQCPFARHCLENDSRGLVFPSQVPRASAGLPTGQEQ